MSEAFANSKMDSTMLHERQLADELAQDAYRADVSFRPDASFLAAIIEYCSESGIELFFIRVKRLRDVKPDKESEELLAYMRRLRSYLENKGVPLLDYTYESRLTKDYFGKGDHLSKTGGKALFTHLLSADFNRLVEDDWNSLVAAKERRQ